jgi:hypothetical protein
VRSFTKSVVEDGALAGFDALGYAVKHGPEIAAGEPPAVSASTKPRTRCAHSSSASAGTPSSSGGRGTGVPPRSSSRS